MSGLPSTRYAPGDANFSCPRCGFQVKYSTTRREFTRHRVCPRCWDPMPEQYKPGYGAVHTRNRILEPSPDPDPLYVEDIVAVDETEGIIWPDDQYVGTPDGGRFGW